MKKSIKILLLIVLSLLVLTLFHFLNTTYPGNIISRIINGAKIVFSPILVALFIMYLVFPMTKRMINSGKVSAKLAIIITMIFVIFSILILLFLIGSFFIEQGFKLYDIISNPEFIENIKIWFHQNNLGDIYDWIQKYISSIDFSKYVVSFSSITSIIFQSFTTIILVPIFLWHFLNAKDVIFSKIEENIPVAWRKNAVPILIDSNEVIVSYFRSKLVSMFILFIMFIFVYVLLGVPLHFIIFFALIIAFLDLIPYLGPTVGLLIPIIYLFSSNGTNLLYINSWHINAITASIILIILNTIIQFVQGNIIIPKLAGKEMQINSALILVFMLFFGYVLGIWGIVLSIPLGGILLVIWKHLKDSGFFNKTEPSEEE